MARVSPDVNFEYFHHANNQITAAPLTMSAWMKDTRDQTFIALHGIISISDFDSVSGDGWRFTLVQNASDTTHNFQFIVENAGTETKADRAETSKTINGVWVHICGVSRAADNSDLSVWVDGAETTATPSANTPATAVDRVTVMAYWRNSIVQSSSFQGHVAEPAFWDRALSDAEVIALSNGYSPTFFKRGLEHYAPFIRDQDRDLITGDAFTVAGSPTVADHPPIIYPAPKFYIMAPPAAGGVTVTVPVASLTLTGFAPTVTVSDHQSVTVPVASLALTGFAPTVTATANITVEIPVASLALAGFAPTVTTTANISIEVPVASLALSGFAPTVTATGNQSVIVPVASLTLTGFAPTVTATGNVSIEVPVASLALAGFAPTVTATGDVSITVPVASLALAGFAPTVQTPVTITIPVASLTLTGFAPTVQTPVSVTVPVASLSLSGFAPIVTATANVSVTVPVASLALSGFSPTVTATGNVSVTVPVASLILTGFAPTIVTLADVSDVDFVLDTWDVESVLDTWNVEIVLTTES
ncbi:hypothetical protein LCGC14_0401160 [marine sediment metagenome]|uniref:LamG-like jellyroll fold domain-containing protein n=1 Tax=marine sediment metagenome TaxID=412755 RepID=A0A0F9W5X2_9ZZZZ